MNTVSEALAWGVNQLSASLGDRALFETRLLLSRVCEASVVDLITKPDRALSDDQQNLFKQWVKRRAGSEPMAYILREREFFGLSFKLTPSVLIPRPETEKLVEITLSKAEDQVDLRVADLGTGSGCIAIALAKHRPHWNILAIDISKEALKVAKENANLHRTTQIAFEHQSIAQTHSGSFDLIVSNPPYIPLSEKKGLQADVRDFEPEVALFAGDNGLEIYRDIFQFWWPLLKPGGAMLLETHDQAQRETLLRFPLQDLENSQIHDCVLELQKAL